MSKKNGTAVSAQIGGVDSHDLWQQLTDPNFCHVETAPGRVMRHKSSYMNGTTVVLCQFGGQPIRFTRLAAQRMVEQLRALGCGKAGTLEIGELARREYKNGHIAGEIGR